MRSGRTSPSGERLKAEMSQGTYQPDNKKVADKMLARMMGLPSEE